MHLNLIGFSNFVLGEKVPNNCKFVILRLDVFNDKRIIIIMNISIMITHTGYINFLLPRTALMRPMLDIPQTVSSQGARKKHRYSSSSIYSHFIDHNLSPPPDTTLFENFTLICTSPELIKETGSVKIDQIFKTDFIA